MNEGAAAAPDASPGLPGKTLYCGSYGSDWEEAAMRLFSGLVEQTGLEPLVLLPTDILFDDYCSAFPVEFGQQAAVRLLCCAAAARSSATPRLVLVDLAPSTLPGDFLLRETNDALVAEWSSDSRLVVLAPSVKGLRVDAFDQHRMITAGVSASESQSLLLG